MVQRYLLLLPLSCVAAFTGETTSSFRTRQPAFSSSSALFGGAKGGATSLAGKKATVEKVKGLLDTSEMIFTVPASSLTVAESETLRRSMPETTEICVVKNKLMARALENTEFESAGNLLKGANMWFFIEDDISATIKAYNSFVKDAGKAETHAILGGILESQNYDSAGVQNIGKLPSKQELYAKIAGSIKAVPTKVARVIKAPSSKLARAIKLATDENNK